VTRILIVEDHALVCEAMVQTLSRLEPGIECVEARGSEEALARLEESSDWDLAVVDLMLPGLNGFALLGVMAKRFPDVPAMVVSGLDDAVSVQRALKAGASGFVPKSCSGEELRRAVRTVLDGGVYVPAIEAAKASRAGMPVSERFGLTNAQARVLELLAQGKTNREIADLLGLSEGTVKVHMSAIFRALKVRSRAQVLVVLSRNGAPPP